MDLNIFRGTAVNITIKIDDNTRIVRRLLGEDIVKSSFNSHDILDIDIGDFIVYEGVKYYVNNLPNIKKNSTNSFDYNITFESEYYELLKTQFLDSDGNSDFYLVGNLETFINLIITNMNRTHSNWLKGTCDQTNTDYRLLSFSKANCMQVLQKLCGEFEGEYYFEIESIGGTIPYKPAATAEISYAPAASATHPYKSVDYGGGNAKSICFTDKAGDNTGLTFEYHQGLRNIHRATLSEKNIVTRLYAFGSEKNLASDYRDHSRRLIFVVDEKSYLEKNIDKYGTIEHTEIFRDIYPHREGTISSVNGADITKFTDSGMDFNLNDYLLPGVTAKLHFNTGNLGGYEFEVSNYDNATKEFTIIIFKDDQGYEMPNATLKPAVGDKYVLLDIKMPQSYIDTAETALQAKAQAYLDENCEPRVTYILEPDWRYFKTHFIDLEAGDFITIVDTDLNINKMTRIVELTKSLANEYKYTLKLSDHLEVQLLQQLYEDQEDLHEIIDIGEGGDIYRSWRNWRTSEELRTMVFDTDGYFDMGKIRPESVETMMLSVGAKSSQFILKNVEIEANYLSLPSKFRASAGELIHLSIDEEIRTWTLSSNTQDSLVDATAYYIYAKCTKEPGYTGQIVVDETQRKFDDDATYYYFLIGVLHSVIDGIRGVSLTYGQTIINGRFIRTGKIESTDGLTYFDLDNSEIRGNIKFSAGMYYTKTFRQATAPTEDMQTGDFWIDTDDGDKTYTYNGSIWVQAYTIINGGNIEAGSLSLISAASDYNWSNLPDDGNKPDNDADVTGNNTAAAIINLPATPAGAGLYATGSYLGYYDSASWKAYIQSNGNFYFGGNASNYIQWNGSSLVLKGSVTLVNTIPNAKVDGLGNLALLDSLAYGDITGTKPPSNADVTLTAIQGELSLAGGGLVLASAGAKIRGGQTAYGVGTGFWLGDVSGVTKFSIGSSTKYLKWDGTTLSIKGVLSLDALSVLNANLGNITAGNITLNSSGFIRTSGKDNYADTTAGFWLGYDSGYKLFIGDANNWLKWTGSALQIKGRLSVGTETNEDIYFEDSEIKLYDYGVGAGEGYKGIALKYSSTVFFTESLNPTNHNDMTLWVDIDSYTRIHTSAVDNYSYIMAKHGDYYVSLNLIPGGANRMFYLRGTGQLQLPALTSDPTSNLFAGQLAIVNNVLRIYNGSAWSNV